ncbi:MAG: SUMF1/EgtB/PvdO family nonheme iron enzyme [Phycisphaerae bacterium]
MALKLFSRKNTEAHPKTQRSLRKDEPPSSSPPVCEYEPAPCETLDSDPLKRLVQQGRHNVILREEQKWRSHTGSEAVVEEAKRNLEQRMALVPAGSVTISHTLTAQPGSPEEDIEVDPFLLDVHCVTNARFQRFVDAGGYDALECWPEEIWPHLIELKDLTGQPGPRFWRNARHDRAFAHHPVVGVSWYEAQAYALWIGQRLPTEAEWQMAASWHINSSTDIMRRFPWGDAMDGERCNIWCSRHWATVPVEEYPNGTAPNQVRQLVGNVWEWTDTEYAIADDEGRPVIGEMPMHVIRGGAFDTYFETQATNYFRTGQIALARVYNTGFRCAMNLSDARWINGE